MAGSIPSIKTGTTKRDLKSKLMLPAKTCSETPVGKQAESGSSRKPAGLR